MKKLKLTDYGLLPIYLSDLNFLQEGIQEQIEALIKPWLPYTDDNCFIVSGIEEDPEINNGYTAGWIVLNGKLYYVDAFVSEEPTSNAHRRWVLLTSYLPTGTKVPKRTTVAVETHEIKTAQVVVFPNTNYTGFTYEQPRLADLIKAILEPSLYKRSGSTADGSYRLQFLQLAHKYVHITGTLWPKLEILSDPNETCSIAVPVPFVLDSDFKDAFDYEVGVNTFGSEGLGVPNPHSLVTGYKGWINFVALDPFTFRIQAEEMDNFGFSANHKAGIPINIIVKIQ